MADSSSFAAGVYRGMSDADFSRAAKVYMSSMERSEKSSKDLYDERLEHCSSCAYRRNASCKLSGSFVELRAAKKNLHCPAEPSRW